MAKEKNIWTEAKKLFEEGMALSKISNTTGISKGQISKKSRSQRWIRDGKACYTVDSSIYIIKAGASDKYKIGVANDIGHRLKNLQTAHYEDLIVIRSFYLMDAYGMERKIHDFLKEMSRHVRGEWFILHNGDIEVIEGMIYGSL